MRQCNRVHGPGTGTADAFQGNAAVFQQRIQNAPGEGAMRATALQGKIDTRCATLIGRMVERNFRR